MGKTLNELGQDLLAQIYEVLTGGDVNVPASPDTFVSWCCPGIPFGPEEFDFAANGLGSGKDAEDQKLIAQHAYNFATVVDFIPDPSGVYASNAQQAVWRTTQARMSQMYGEILNASKVVTYQLTDAEKAELEKFRSLLHTTVTTKNLVTGVDITTTVDGPVLQAYNAAMANYIAAALEYNAKRIAASAATGQEGKAAVLDWMNNQNLYALKVKAARDAWTASGYRNEVDQMNARIDQTTRRSMELWKARLIEDFEGAKVSALGPGQTYPFTTLVPGNFAQAGGWTRLSHDETHQQAHQRASNSSWSANAGLNLGLFSIGGGASGKDSQLTANSQLSSFSLSFELCQVVIARGWFYPEFFMNKGWTLRPGEGWTFPGMPSDGTRPPQGVLASYPTTVLFARNIKIKSAEFASAYSEFSHTVGGGASFGWGPFSIGGSYQRTNSGYDQKVDVVGDEISVDGLQIIGFVNRLVPKAPDPLPSIPPADFK